MLAITTRYLSPTNKRGARIKAEVNGYTATVPYDYALSDLDRHYADLDRHYAAVKALVEKHKLNWDIKTMTWGYAGGGKGGQYVFCFPASTITFD